MTKTALNLIGGEWTGSPELERRNPARSGEVAATRLGTTVDDIAARSRATIPAGRYGDPAEFGAVGTFLCGELASYVTGTTLRVDGGLVRSH